MIACDPTSFLRGRCNLLDASEKFSVTLRKVACDPRSFLCGRCKCLATMVTLLLFCAAGAIFSMPPRSSSFVWQAQYFRCLREVPCDPTSFLCGRCNIFVSSEKCFVVLRSFSVAGAIFSMQFSPSYTLKGGFTYKAIFLSTM